MSDTLLPASGIIAPDPFTAPILPDSRLRDCGTPRHAVQGPMGWMVPIYCPNCGVKGGEVPQENMTFAFWMCDPCYAKFGHLTTMAVMPDEVFWEKIKQEQLSTFKRELSAEELQVIVDADASPLATLLKEGRAPHIEGR